MGAFSRHGDEVYSTDQLRRGRRGSLGFVALAAGLMTAGVVAWDRAWAFSAASVGLWLALTAGIRVLWLSWVIWRRQADDGAAAD